MGDGVDGLSHRLRRCVRQISNKKGILPTQPSTALGAMGDYSLSLLPCPSPRCASSKLFCFAILPLPWLLLRLQPPPAMRQQLFIQQPLGKPTPGLAL